MKTFFLQLLIIQELPILDPWTSCLHVQLISGRVSKIQQSTFSTQYSFKRCPETMLIPASKLWLGSRLACTTLYHVLSFCVCTEIPPSTHWLQLIAWAMKSLAWHFSTKEKGDHARFIGFPPQTRTPLDVSTSQKLGTSCYYVYYMYIYIHMYIVYRYCWNF